MEFSRGRFLVLAGNDAGDLILFKTTATIRRELIN